MTDTPTPDEVLAHWPIVKVNADSGLALAHSHPLLEVAREVCDGAHPRAPHIRSGTAHRLGA